MPCTELSTCSPERMVFKTIESFIVIHALGFLLVDLKTNIKKDLPHSIFCMLLVRTQCSDHKMNEQIGSIKSIAFYCKLSFLSLVRIFFAVSLRNALFAVNFSSAIDTS